MDYKILQPVILLLATLLSSGCHRPVTTPPHNVTPMETSLQALTPWIDAEADVILIADLPTMIATPVLKPWLAALAHGRYGALFGKGSMNLSQEIGLAAFYLRFDRGDQGWSFIQRQLGLQTYLIAEYVVLHVQGDSASLQTKLRQRLSDPTNDTAVMPLAPNVIAIGNRRGLAWLMHHRDRAPTHVALPGTPALAWGTIHTAAAATRMLLPHLWHAVEQVTFTISATEQLHLSADLHFSGESSASLFMSTLDGILALSTTTTRETPWLTLLLRSTTVDLANNRVHVETDIPADVVLQPGLR